MDTQKKILYGETICSYHSCLNADSCSGKPGLKNNCYVPWVANPNQVDHHEFASALAHEVRNPLASINLSAEILALALKDDELKMYLDIIVRNSARINDLIAGFLRYQHKDEVNEEKYSVGVMIDEVLDIAADRLRLKNIKVVKQLGIKDIEITVNRPKMKIALTNIIINAIDAMSVSNGVLKLSIRAVKGQYELQIQDNGCGISKENLHSIFNAGFTNKPGGLGFGLQMTSDILRSNHVGIKVQSKLGKWTRFILLFSSTSGEHRHSITPLRLQSKVLQMHA